MSSSTLVYQKPLDGLRGIAIMLVLMVHQYIAEFGWIGVQLFFVLSGYLITRILFLEKEKSIKLGVKFKNFWMRRILRIFPLYYLYLFILLVVYIVSNYPNGLGSNLPYLFTYTYNFKLSSTLDFSQSLIRHLWSLSVEEQFYLIYPFIVLLGSKRFVKVATIALVFFSVLFRIIYSEYLQTSFGTNDLESAVKTYFVTFSHFDFFLAGASIVIFKLHYLTVRRQAVLFFSSLFAFIIVGVINYVKMNGEIVCITCFLNNLGFEFWSVQFHWTYLALNLFFFSILVLLVSNETGKLNFLVKKITSFPILVAIGKVSYGMYIVHMGLSYLLSVYKDKVGFSLNGYLLFAIYSIVVYLLAKLSFELYEKRFLKLKDKFR